MPESRTTRLSAIRIRLEAAFAAAPTIWVVSALLSIWLGLSWVVYRLEYLAEDANITTYGEGVWWGIVTFLTVGYGDRYPVTSGGRFAGSLLMMAGVVAVGIVTAKISSVFFEQALRKRRGFVDFQKLKDHFIVCGWKEEMQVLLAHILDFNPGLSAEQVILVAAIDDSAIDLIRSHPRLKKLQVLSGPYYEEGTLAKASPRTARKVLILADRTPTRTGAIPSPTEVDARTIMTAMTLSHIARGTLVAAEILDPKMDQYLKLAQVSEIIYSREYSRLLLANASGGTGVSNIIFDLLDPRTPTWITTLPVPDSCLGSTYGEVKRCLEAGNPQRVVVGILENTGNRQSIKELALRQAQKTPDMGRLVQNLRSVKELKCNSPMFNPGEAHLVLEGSMAIVIETRDGAKRNTLDGTLATAAA